MSADFTERRVKMVDGQIRTTDVTNVPLLDAFLSVPRELFVDESVRELAYIDEDIRIADGDGGARFLMEPSPLARLLQAAEIRNSDSVLDIGCGTGYSSAILSQVAASVTALESDPELAGKARETLGALGYGNVSVVEGPLRDGWKTAAPYDVIVLQGSIDELPEQLQVQLAEGGRLVAVEGRGNAGVARIFLNTNGVVTGRRAFNAAIRPLPGFERSRVFEF
ncbi:protein-L-isoaspartate O-methyltransferase [Aquamicrobium sp.]|uniref:protein-L-isoaspartate O-methyltransferase family protein n=1 Tax=Aquamicrobium sp. TaxID=1872579 RepID=UPI00258EE63C|nr:protein-L-isoaspartate O-methyltransferase [Aquamicrobium sp.]MCK9551934.1 protein-L-isoaspartate O-methyltransferase [Aquamicrobium sp.]